MLNIQAFSVSLCAISVWGTWDPGKENKGQEKILENVMKEKKKA